MTRAYVPSVRPDGKRAQVAVAGAGIELVCAEPAVENVAFCCQGWTAE